MKEYNYQIEKYSLEGYEMYADSKSLLGWGNKIIAENYLEKYWLLESEYLNKWKQIQNTIFIKQINKTLLYPLFYNKFQILALGGGVLFDELEFIKLQKCMLEIGDSYFVIIEDNFDNEPPFRLKYPTTISWNELTNGNFISTILFNMPHKEYFVYGDSGFWGKYCTNDSAYPLDIYGFEPKYEHIFRNKFLQTKEEFEEVKKEFHLFKNNYRSFK